ncbi:MAG: hypothetical protein JWN78_1150, partial [Bacteroidota bacterium]|nr:hypothetical protein [Bacteroidota bacterium]
MKNIYIILLLTLLSKFSFAQLANVTYSVKTVNVTSHENAITGACWEAGGEEYTAFLASWDDVNGTQVSTNCQTCDNNGDCAYAANIALQTRSNNAYALGFTINAWEDDNGSRCAFETCSLCNNDDCQRNENQSYSFREGSFPSNGGYAATPTYGSTGDHTYSFQYTWKYSGTTNLLTPSCSVQSAAYSASAIRSWSINLTAGTTYNFNSCTSPGDTYLRIYGTDGFSIVGSNDDACGTNGWLSSVNYTPASSGTYYIEMANWVSGTLRGPLANAGTLSYSLIDNQAPTISCPANISTNTASGTCAATVSYTTPVGADNCSATTTRTGGLASGSSFPLGTTTNTFNVTDGVGLTATCSFTVTVNDGQAPSITCPANQTISATSGTCAATATYTAPVGTDNCTGSTTAQIAGSSSGASYAVGVTTNTFRVTDGAGNSTSCSFTITVNDTQAPAITCPANQSVSAAAGTCAATVTYTAPTGTDNCSGSSTARIAGLASGSSFPVGVTTNTFRVTDASSNSTSCSFTVTVTDTQSPAITCPANQSVNAAANTCAATVSYTAPVGTDNCSSPVTIQTSGLGSGASYAVGVTTNIFKVTDASSNSTTCSFTITVNDIQAPVISCAGKSVSVNAAANTCAATVSYTAPVGTDNCSGSITTQTGGLASGASYPVGVTTNIFKVTDASNNSTTCNFTVTVTDAQAPVISCAGKSVSVNAAANTCAATVSYTAPVGTDNCSGSVTTQTGGLASGASYPVGVTTNIFKVTDASNNSTTCNFTVTVTDAQAPSIICPANQTVSAITGLCEATVSYTTPVGTDNCSGAVTTQIAGLASGSTYPVGVTTNIFRVTDASNNSTTCNFTVTVQDNEAPQIFCPGDEQSGNDAGFCSWILTYSSPSASDNCSGYTIAQTTGLASGSAFPVGVTTNTFKVTATNGQTATCSFTVTVFDFENPTITCPADLNIDNDAGICGAVVVYTTPAGTDNCPGASTLRTAGLASGSTFPSGTTTNTFTVTDASGNSAECT